MFIVNFESCIYASSKQDWDCEKRFELALAIFVIVGIEASLSATLSSDMMKRPTVSIGLVCQAVSSSFGVVI